MTRTRTTGCSPSCCLRYGVEHLALGYEIPKYDGDLGRPNVYVPMSEEIARTKVELLSKAYPLTDRPGLVGRGDLSRAGPTTRDGVPVPLRGGFHDEQGDSYVVEMSQL